MNVFETSYNKAREVYLGKNQIHKAFKPFLDWFENQYSIPLLNVICHYNPSGNELDLWFTKESEYLNFCHKHTGFPERFLVEEIRDAYNFIMKKNIVPVFYNAIGSIHFACSFPILMSLEQYEKRFIVEQLNNHVINDFVKTLDNPQIWTIAPQLDQCSIFLFTRAQVEVYKSSPILEVWKKRYFEFLKKYDELDFYKYENFNLYLDSQEKFYSEYGGSWYTFYK